VTTMTASGARFPDLVWLTWRQHRWSIIAAVVALGGYGVACQLVQPGRYGVSGLFESLALFAQIAAGLVAVFWGAPLLAREHEQRTHLLSWGQDVSPVRWSVSKAALLAAGAVVVATGLGLAGTAMLSRMSRPGNGPFSTWGFELWPPMQIVYALFGLALGVAVSAVARRTVPAMGITLVGFTAVRVFVAVWMRPTYLPPVRTTYPLAEQGFPIPPDALRLDFGDVDAAGRTISQSQILQCAMRGNHADFTDLAACEKKLGATQSFVDYQPIDRLLTFHLIEMGIFLLLSAGLFVLACRLVGRQGAL